MTQTKPHTSYHHTKCSWTKFICMLITYSIIAWGYSRYLEMLHENNFWFTNIREVEREISFRTEQGFYYSFYKTLVRTAPYDGPLLGITKGLERLMADNTTESGRVINALTRFNILQEIILATLYRIKYYLILLFRYPLARYGHDVSELEIFFYIRCVFSLNGFGLFMMAFSSFLLCGHSYLAGILTALWFVVNKNEGTRVFFSIPLRESFSLPFLFAQTAPIISYLRYDSPKTKETIPWKKLVFISYFITTFLFAATWQFAQFILLLQSICLFVLYLLKLVSASCLIRLYGAIWVALLSVSVIQFGEKMLLGSFIMSFIPSAILVIVISSVFRPGILRLFLMGILIPVLTLLMNAAVKWELGIDEDQHVTAFLLAKLTGREPVDFVTRLYICNEGFKAPDWEVLSNLSFPSFLLPVYVISIVAILSISAIYVISVLGKVKSDTKNFGSRVIEASQAWMENHSDCLYLLLFSISLCAMTAMAVRMKFVAVPFLTILAAFGLVESLRWIDNYLRSVLKNLWIGQLVFLPPLWDVFTAILWAIIGFLGYQLKTTIEKEMEDLTEFWDPDTVELMEWIAQSTPVTAVFAGSMQLLAGVKLCTGRAITNHPHFENKWLRERTLQIYQIYAKRSPEDVHAILTEAGASYIILEESLCLAQPKNGCSLPEILDIHQRNKEYIQMGKKGGLPEASWPLFCLEVRYRRPHYAKRFLLVFANKTFRVYMLL